MGNHAVGLDVTTQFEALRRQVSTLATLRWHRGHPEDRHDIAQFGDWCEHDKRSYRVDELAEEAYEKYKEDINRHWWDFPHAQRWKLWWRGKPLRGDIKK
jgi:hypothetical protein